MKEPQIVDADFEVVSDPQAARDEPIRWFGLVELAGRLILWAVALGIMLSVSSCITAMLKSPW